MIVQNHERIREKPRTCTIHHYTPAWTIGTGLQTALAPGMYRITGQQYVNGNRYLTLDDRFRVDARFFHET